MTTMSGITKAVAAVALGAGLKPMNRKLGAAAAAGLIAAGIVVAPPAQADETWSSIFVEHNGTGWGASDNYPTKASAQNAAMNDCQETGAAICRHVATSTRCVSAARNDDGWNGGVGPTNRAAEADALAGSPGGHIVVTRC